MKEYRVKVNGETYEVQIEEVNSSASPSPRGSKATQDQPVRPAPIEVTRTARTETSRPRVAAGEIRAPMSGKILKIEVEPGQKVRNGETLLILEAMKMENEIYAPADGMVKDIIVQVNSTVNSGDLIMVLE